MPVIDAQVYPCSSTIRKISLTSLIVTDGEFKQRRMATRTSSQNINLCYCYHFVIISSFLRRLAEICDGLAIIRDG